MKGCRHPRILCLSDINVIEVNGESNCRLRLSRSEEGLRVCLSNKQPHDSSATSLWTTLCIARKALGNREPLKVLSRDMIVV